MWGGASSMITYYAFCECVACITHKTWNISSFGVITVLYGHFYILSPSFCHLSHILGFKVIKKLVDFAFIINIFTRTALESVGPDVNETQGLFFI